MSVPTDSKKANVGPAAKLSQPVIEQLFIKSSNGIDQDEFERKLYLIRKQFSHQLRTNKKLTQANLLFACSLSSKIIVYKGMLTPSQLFPFYPDLDTADYIPQSHSHFPNSRKYGKQGIYLPSGPTQELKNAKVCVDQIMKK